jgi:ubiquinone/menaquinone biosynthesis C-methylase UbiE
MSPMDEFDADAFTAQSRETWNESAPRYDKLSCALFGPIADEFAAFAGLRKGWQALEIACGPGVASRAAARRLGEKGSLLATDFSPVMLATASARAPERRAAPIEWRAADAQTLDLPDASFDAVFCQLGLMLFARPDDALSEMRRVAKPAAPVSCLVQGRKSAMLFTSLVLDAIVARAPHLRAPKGAPNLYAFGSDGVLEAAFARAGLTEIVTTRRTGAFRFASPEEYWTTMTEGSGRTGAMLRSLSPELQAKIKADVLRRAAKRRVGRFVEMPYEFALARGLAPRRN